MNEPISWTTVITALITVVPVTIATIASLRPKLAAVETKVDVIHDLANSRLTKMGADLDSANKQITAMQTTIDKLVDSKATISPKTINP